MKTKKNWIEWTVFAVSLIVVGVFLALLLIDALRSEEKTPRLRIVAGTPVEEGQLFRVPVRVYNDGGGTAEHVRVEASLDEQDRSVERADLTFEHVPRRSFREGSIVFRNDPRRFTLKIHPAGFLQP